MGGCRGDTGEGLAEAHIATLRAVHGQGLLLCVVVHRHLLALGIRQRDVGRTLQVDQNLAGLGGLLHHLAAQGLHLLRRHHTAVGLRTVGEQVEVAGNGVGRAELAGGHLVGILPVRHPRYHHAATIGSVVERHRGIVVLAVVEPLGHLGARLAGESVTVEVAHEVLGSRTAEGTAGVDVAQQHPLLLARAANGQTEHVGTLPHTGMTAVFRPEAAL